MVATMSTAVALPKLKAPILTRPITTPTAMARKIAASGWFFRKAAISCMGAMRQNASGRPSRRPCSRQQHDDDHSPDRQQRVADRIRHRVAEPGDLALGDVVDHAE